MRKYKVMRRAMEGFQKQKNEANCSQIPRKENRRGMLLAIVVVDLMPVLMAHTYPLFLFESQKRIYFSCKAASYNILEQNVILDAGYWMLDAETRIS
jgi:hypothetical protein